jgi:toxin-antitoxin system PIN domain toxin
MKTTLDLPEPLVEEVRRRAHRDGRELGETLIGLVKKGLEVTSSNPPTLEPAVVTTSALGFPLIAKHTAHERVASWMATAGSAPLLFCRSTQQSVLRLLTTARVFAAYQLLPITNAEAWDIYRAFFNDQRVSFCEEPAGVAARWQALASLEAASPKRWMAAYLAAFAIAGGYQFITTDAGFRQYPNLDLLLI